MPARAICSRRSTWLSRYRFETLSCTGSRQPVFRTTQRSIRVLEKAGFQREGLLAILSEDQRQLAGPLSLRPRSRMIGRRQDNEADSWHNSSGAGHLLAFAVRGTGRAVRRLIRRSAIEPIKIARDDAALDLSGAVEIYREPGRDLPGFDRARPRRHRPAHRGRGQRRPLDRRLGRLRARQHHRRTARPPDRRAAFPAGELRPVLARSRLEPHRCDHAQRGFRARPPGQPRRRRVPDHAQPRRGRHLRRRTGLAKAAAGLSVGPRGLQGHGQLLHALSRHRHRHRRPAGAVPDHPFRRQGNLDVSRDGRARPGRCSPISASISAS